MLTVMCPNCRHRFPANGCCESESVPTSTTERNPCFYGGILVPKGYSGGGCFINAPTILQNPQITLSVNERQLGSELEAHKHSRLEKRTEGLLLDVERGSRNFVNPDSVRLQDIGERKSSTGCHITTTCDLTGGTVTITTPGIQSGGCLIQSQDSPMVVQGQQMEIKPKLSGGGCFLQKQLSTERQEPSIVSDLRDNRYEDDSMECSERNDEHRMFLLPPSGCEELPGTRRCVPPSSSEKRCDNFRSSSTDLPIFSSFQVSNVSMSQNQHRRPAEECGASDHIRSGSCYCTNCKDFCRPKPSPSLMPQNKDIVDRSPGLQIQVNATVQLPASFSQCTVNITATTGNTPGMTSNPTTRSRDHFNGGGLIQDNETAVRANVDQDNFEERRSPTTPVSWLMPCPFGLDTLLIDRDIAKMNEVKRCLQICGWYHEGLSWQQSEDLLKTAKVGRWLMRDSSDSRFTFAVSVQTARGPTSVRVQYFLGRFRLDADPRLAFALPLFDCPIQMLQYYVEYSKSVDEDRKEVWVDYSGQLYSEIYLTKPLLKEVSSLSHLARLVVNRHKLKTDHLPPIIKSYLAEYPYTL